MSDLRKISAFFRRELVYRFMNKADLYIIVFLPVLTLLLYLLLGRFAGTFGYLGIEVDAASFLGFSIIAFLFSWHVAENMIASLFEQKGVIMHYLETPATIFHVMAGSFLVGLLQAFLFLAIQLIYLQPMISAGQSVYMIMLTAITLLSMIGIGLVLASACFWTNQAGNVLSMARVLMLIISGALFHIQTSWVKILFPPALYVELARKTYLLSEFPSLKDVLLLLGLSLLYLAAGYFFMRNMMERAQSEGRI